MSIIKTGVNKLSNELRAEVEKALLNPEYFYSTEKEIFPWLLLAFIGSVAGFFGGLFTASWDMVSNSLTHSDSWMYIAENNPELLGICGGVIGAVISLWYGIKIHNRCGQLLLPGAVAKIRGNRIVILNASDTSDVEVNSFEYGSADGISAKSGVSLKVKLADGTVFTMLADSGYWLDRVKLHLKTGKI